ncbi:hypothetical protein ACSBLW_11430 [Thioclava sp. FR2]|uniref:hypothetical protein n=1 Tax=Thioclava sp. FR2 TaxID=3445780 RepID=UPI003EBF19DB
MTDVARASGGLALVVGPRLHLNEPAQEAPDSVGLRLLMLALAVVCLFHGGLLPFTHGNTYDAFIHMFFGDSYHRSWFDVWEPRWYTGFATTSYPPGTHMAIGALQYVMPLRAAFVVTMLLGLILLTIGVYRYALIWVEPRAAGYAAISLALSSSISETVHLFGQLPTIFSLGVFLNGLPSVYGWIVGGRWRDFLTAVLFACATTAAHHVTTLFGSVLFILPLAPLSLRVVAELNSEKTRKQRYKSLSWAFMRGIFLGVFMVGSIVITVLPYWIWSINDPITQVPIPHGSRENFLEKPHLGLIFFLLPWGLALVALPYVFVTSLRTRMFPLGLAVFLGFVLGTGGTTPLPRAMLRGAFDILTLDRFTFWASILILPFLGRMFESLLHGRAGDVLRKALGRGGHRVLVGSGFFGMVGVSVFAAILPALQPMQPKFVDPTPIVQFLEQDEHDHWRYLTLGLGDQFAYLSAQTEAQSVDGNYHSARRLPDLTRFSVERLENAKFSGVPGLGSLRQFLINADTYNLKYIFSNDGFYDPLLFFTGWDRLQKLPNGIAVWEKPDVSPLPLVSPRRAIPVWQMVMWGALPPFVLVLALGQLMLSTLRYGFGMRRGLLRPAVMVTGPVGSVRLLRWLILGALLFVLALLSWGAVSIWHETHRPLSAEEQIEAYFTDLDMRRFRAAYERFDPITRPEFDRAMFNWRWQGGLIASYGKLQDVALEEIGGTEVTRRWRVRLSWLTAVNLREELREVSTVLRDGIWYVEAPELRPTQTPERLQRRADIDWNLVGRRQARLDADLHRDRLDRPRIFLHGARLVEKDGRFSIVGALTNGDADPAKIMVLGDLRAEGKGPALARMAAGMADGQRLLPAETSGFRIEFEGVLSLQDAAGEFDPTRFVPPELAARPDGATIEARALVAGLGLYRAVGLNGLRISTERGRLQLSGQAVNTGTEVATVTRVVALLYDEAGLPVWTEAGFVDRNIVPGQGQSFVLDLPARNEIKVIADLGADDMVVNGASQQSDTGLPDAATGTIPLTGVPGYSALRLHISSMVHEPLF